LSEVAFSENNASVFSRGLMCTNIVCRWRINEIFTSLYSLVQLMYYLFGFSNSCQTFEVHAVVNIKITVFRDVTSYSLVHLPHYMVWYLNFIVSPPVGSIQFSFVLCKLHNDGLYM
jgi:hypothetical protein